MILDVQPNVHDYIQEHVPGAVYMNEALAVKSLGYGAFARFIGLTNLVTGWQSLFSGASQARVSRQRQLPLRGTSLGRGLCS